MSRGLLLFLTESIDDLIGIATRLRSYPQLFSLESRPGRSIGKHMRHCFNHLEMIVEALKKASMPAKSLRNDVGPIVINYDQRLRDPRLEGSVEFTLEQLSSLRQDVLRQLEDVSPIGDWGPLFESPVRIRFLRSTQPAVWDSALSTLGREIHYTVLHNTHHVALIKELGTELGLMDLVSPHAEKAKSTIVFEHEAEQSPISH